MDLYYGQENFLGKLLFLQLLQFTIFLHLFIYNNKDENNIEIQYP